MASELAASINIEDLGLGAGVETQSSWHNEMLMMTRDIRDALVELSSVSRRQAFFGRSEKKGDGGGILGEAALTAAFIKALNSPSKFLTTLAGTKAALTGLGIAGLAAAIAGLSSKIGEGLATQITGGDGTAVGQTNQGPVSLEQGPDGITRDQFGNPYQSGGIVDITPTGGGPEIESTPSTTGGDYGLGEDTVESREAFTNRFMLGRSPVLSNEENIKDLLEDQERIRNEIVDIFIDGKTTQEEQFRLEKLRTELLEDYDRLLAKTTDEIEDSAEAQMMIQEGIAESSNIQGLMNEMVKDQENLIQLSTKEQNKLAKAIKESANQQERLNYLRMKALAIKAGRSSDVKIGESRWGLAGAGGNRALLEKYGSPEAKNATGL